MGDHDFKPTPTGQIVRDFLAGAMPAYIDTGLNVVNVRDVALGHLLACENGKRGRALHPRLREHDAGPDPAGTGAHHGPQSAHYRTPVLRRLHRRRGHHSLAQLTGTPPRAPLEAVRMAKKKMWVSHEKATRELGYSPCPPPALCPMQPLVHEQWFAK